MFDSGDGCNQDGCDGVFIRTDSENCSCHINPPCPSCIDTFLYCSECGYEIHPKPFNYNKRSINSVTKSLESSNVYQYKSVSNPDDKVRYIHESTGYAHAIISGSYPNDMTFKEVISELDRRLNLCFGYSVIHLDSNKFRLKYYTD